MRETTTINTFTVVTTTFSVQWCQWRQEQLLKGVKHRQWRQKRKLKIYEAGYTDHKDNDEVNED